MASNSFLAPDVDLPKLAEVTKNFSGAELEGLVKSAASFALNRNVDINDLHKPLDEDNIKVGRGARAAGGGGRAGRGRRRQREWRRRARPGRTRERAARARQRPPLL
jgi:hypothetical protein